MPPFFIIWLGTKFFFHILYQEPSKCLCINPCPYALTLVLMHTTPMTSALFVTCWCKNSAIVHPLVSLKCFLRILGTPKNVKMGWIASYSKMGLPCSRKWNTMANYCFLHTLLPLEWLWTYKIKSHVQKLNQASI